MNKNIKIPLSPIRYLSFWLVLIFISLLCLTPSKQLHAEKKNYEEGLYVRIHGGLGWGTLNLGAVSDPIEKRKSKFEAFSPLTSVHIGSPLNPNWILHGGVSRVHAVNASDKNKTYPFSSYQLTSFSIGMSHYVIPHRAYISLQYRFLGQLSHTKKRGPTIGSMGTIEVKYFCRSGTKLRFRQRFGDYYRQRMANKS